MDAPETSGKNVIIIGAGIVGACSALYLQREGYNVTLITRDAPGEACSYGNSGGVGGPVSVLPLALPGILWRAPRYLMDPNQPLSIRWRNFPAMLPWFARFIQSSAPDRVEAITAARAKILLTGMDAFWPILEAAGAKSLLRSDPGLTVFESDAAFEASRSSRDLARRHGVGIEEVTGDQAREMNPALGPTVKWAAVVTDHHHTINPLRMVQMLIEQAVRAGALVRRETVRNIEIGTSGPGLVVTDAGSHSFDKLVVAAGVWSKSLARLLGTRVLLEAQRGYHNMLPNPGVTMTRMTTLADRNVVLTPMEHGLRITGIAEFALPEAPPRYVHADRLLRQAKAVVPKLNTAGAVRWMGSRPQTPDSLPVIGYAPRFPGRVVFAFGHGQNGLQMGAITGKLVSELVAGKPTSIDVTPYRADRF